MRIKYLFLAIFVLLGSAYTHAQSSSCQVCNWYGQNTPLCINQNSGWGYEAGESCVGSATCSDQWGSGGIVNSCSGTPTPTPTVVPTQAPTQSPTPGGSAAAYLQHSSSGQYYSTNSSGQLARNASSTSSAQGLEKVQNGGGYSFRAVGGSFDGMYSYEPSGSNRQELTADLSAAEVFFEYSCGNNRVYFLSNTTGKSLKNESNNMLGNGSGGKCGSSNNEFTWVGGSVSPGPNPTPTPTSNPTPPPSGGQGIPSIITNGSLWDLEGKNPHPLVNPNTLVFVPLQAKVTTPNGNGWRHEYKIKSSKRIPMPSYYEYFKATIKVGLSKGGKTIVAQYHAEGISTLMKLYIADSSESGIGDSNPGDGVFGVYVRMLDKNTGKEVKKALGTIRTGDSFTFESINNYGKVSVKALGKTLTTQVQDGGASYLKFGNYLQSQYPNGNKNCGSKGDSSSFARCYADIGITTAKITMTNMTYERR